MEIWKQIKGYGYKVSNYGRVISSIYRPNCIMSRIGRGDVLLKNIITSRGYCVVSLYKDRIVKQKRVHRLLMEAFVDNPLNLLSINHKDGNPSNNHIDNLEWCTSSYNQQHAYDTGLREPTRGEKSGLAKLTEDDVLFIRTFGSLFSEQQLRDIFNMSVAGIRHIVRRTRWKHI